MVQHLLESGREKRRRPLINTNKISMDGADGACGPKKK